MCCSIENTWLTRQKRTNRQSIVSLTPISIFDTSSQTAQGAASTTSKDPKAAPASAANVGVDVGKIANLVTTDLRVRPFVFLASSLSELFLKNYSSTLCILFNLSITDNVVSSRGSKLDKGLRGLGNISRGRSNCFEYPEDLPSHPSHPSHQLVCTVWVCRKHVLTLMWSNMEYLMNRWRLCVQVLETIGALKAPNLGHDVRSFSSNAERQCARRRQ